MSLNRVRNGAGRLGLLLLLTFGAFAADVVPLTVTATLKVGSRHLTTFLTTSPNSVPPSRTCVTVEADGRELSCQWFVVSDREVEVTIGSGSENVIVKLTGDADRGTVRLVGGAPAVGHVGRTVGAYYTNAAPQVTSNPLLDLIGNTSRNYYALRARESQANPPQVNLPTQVQRNVPTGMTSQTIPPFATYSVDNGVTGASQQIGQFTFFNFSNGVAGTTQQVGPFSFSNWNNGLNGTGQRIGNLGFYNWNDGSNATSNRVGNFTFTNFSNGTNCTTNTIGQFTYTNCN